MEGLVGKEILVPRLQRGDSGMAFGPGDRRAGRSQNGVDHAAGGFDDFGSDPVARDQGTAVFHADVSLRKEDEGGEDT